MDWKVWLKGLVAAAISGAAHSITVIVVDPVTFNLDSGCGKLSAVAAISALVGVAMYLQKSPLPEK